jgi:hypothetical protein
MAGRDGMPNSFTGVTGSSNMQRPRPETRRYRRSAGLCVIGSARLTARPGRPCDGRGGHYLTWWGVAGRKCPPAVVGAALIVGSALAFALDGPVARAAYQRGLDPAAFGFWRASAGALVLGCGRALSRRSGRWAGRPLSGWRWRPWPGWA